MVSRSRSAFSPAEVGLQQICPAVFSLVPHTYQLHIKLICNVFYVCDFAIDGHFAVYRLARDLLVAVVTRWNEHVLVIDKVIPPNWKVKHIFGMFLLVFALLFSIVKKNSRHDFMHLFVSFLQFLGSINLQIVHNIVLLERPLWFS